MLFIDRWFFFVAQFILKKRFTGLSEFTSAVCIISIIVERSNCRFQCSLLIRLYSRSKRRNTTFKVLSEGAAGLLRSNSLLISPAFTITVVLSLVNTLVHCTLVQCTWYNSLLVHKYCTSIYIGLLVHYRIGSRLPIIYTYASCHGDKCSVCNARVTKSKLLTLGHVYNVDTFSYLIWLLI